MSSNLLNSTNDTILDGYDYDGAAIYIAVILIWYSSGLALMLFLQIRPRTYQSQFLFDNKINPKSPLSHSNPFANYHNIQADNATKQILTELKDPERRQRLWKIYYSIAEKQNEQSHKRYYDTITADNVTIDRIKRKLDDIHRMTTSDDYHLTMPSTGYPSNNNPSKSNKKFPFRRPSETTTAIARQPLVRVRSQPDTPSATSFIEEESITLNEKSNLSSTNNSRKRNNKFLSRFTVERVPDPAVKLNTLK